MPPARKTFLGIELGSTRIKAALIDSDHQMLAAGAFDWQNRLENGVWTYGLGEVREGLRACFADLSRNVKERYGAPLRVVGGLGVSAMMHGYLAFDKAGALLAPFRTWRNTMTEEAARALSAAFAFNIPQRWSIAHLYQAMLRGEPHVKDLAFLTTLAGYVHWQLTGRKVLGVGDASGMFPIDSVTKTYDKKMMAAFKGLKGDYGWSLEGVLPEVLSAGDDAGVLSEEGAAFLDPTGALRPGVPLCPPEGDAGTGMAATNSVACRSGNVSAGTSVFAMVVLEKPLSRVYPEIDMVTTPSGRPVAMVHCNNCTSDLDAWVKLLGEAAARFGARPAKGALYDALYEAALEGEPDCGGLVSCNYYSGEPVTGFEAGRPFLARLPEGRFNLANLMRSLLFSAAAALKIGMDILTEKEKVSIDCLLGHGGLFKTKGVGQRLLAAALNVPVAVLESAGEGGAWGIALLAAYQQQRAAGESLEAYLADKVFAGSAGARVTPDAEDARGFAAYIERYKAALAAERALVENLVSSKGE
ncbi:MAG: ATPase [Treponema sp.]|jgi:sugar (pentulose or hexulose) kinase|nr:ATPase [Treponema sp.]